MTEVVLNKLSYDRLTAALELLRFKTVVDKFHHLALEDVNEVLTVAGFDIIPEPKNCEEQKEVEVIEV